MSIEILTKMAEDAEKYANPPYHYNKNEFIPTLFIMIAVLARYLLSKERQS
jgi:hypothetical protein